MYLKILHQPFNKEDFYFNKVYSLYEEVWIPATHDEFFQDDFHSDYFSKHEIILAIFEGLICKAFISLKLFNLCSQCDLKDSYFDIWDYNSIDIVRKHGSKVATCANLTVSPSCRRDSSKIVYKDLMFSLVRKYLLESPNIDSIISVPRRERNVHLSAYRYGAKPIKEDVIYDKFPNQTVDLLAWFKDSLGEINGNKCEINLSNSLWENRNNQWGSYEAV